MIHVCLARAIVAGLLLAVSVHATAGAGDRSRYLWENRLLLMVAPADTDPRFADARRRVEQRWDAVLDRDMVVLYIFTGSGVRANDNAALAGEEVGELRRRYGLEDNETTMILIGKDGGEKLRRPLDNRLREPFTLIDTMPMRQLEMDEKRRRGEPVTPP